ncbi:Na(+)/H(+) exchange regulatory cofactor NHE-RF3 [Salarias fasciatus]|uniref:Na(+)/H(+) exchange regulatory cofactor NHE-RF3 n=1 Tax=Salarias fasciatus TaxID=181472 RepID=UPI001176C372|nr:Na(+)/H(+) exchange regulatory cofactor NHE-RF3 [Salarias fasciatus]
MDSYRPKVICLTKRPGQTFGFNLRLEHGEEGHLVRGLEMGGPAELAGMKDGDRILRVNGTFADSLPHSEVVDLVRNSGTSVTFHLLGEAAYKQAKEKGVDLSDSQTTPVVNGEAKHSPKPKLCYLVKSSSGFGFSLCSVKGKPGVFMTEVIPGGAADRAGIKLQDRLVEVNGDNIENRIHDEVVAKIKMAGSSIMFLLVDEEADRFYKSKHIKIGTWEATTKHLPLQPRIVDMTKGSDGYGFVLREEPNMTGHFVKNIERGSPAEREGIKEMDRVVAVNGKEVGNCNHEMVVDLIKKGGNKCCLFVMDRETDKMYQLGNVSPMLYWEENNNTNSPPSYNEAVMYPSLPQSSTSFEEKEEVLKPKLCRMEKTAQGYGFHLNGIQGVHGQFIRNVVKGGAADRAGMENNDIVVEVNGVNVEECSHEEAVKLIRDSGDTLEMLVAKKSVYDQLKADGVAITKMLVLETLYAQVHKTNSPETKKTEIPEEPRAESPAGSERQRSPSVSSNSSIGSVDERF